MPDLRIDTAGEADAAALAALGRTLASIARSRFDLDKVLQAVVEEAAELCGLQQRNDRMCRHGVATN